MTSSSKCLAFRPILVLNLCKAEEEYTANQFIQEPFTAINAKSIVGQNSKVATAYHTYLDIHQNRYTGPKTLQGHMSRSHTWERIMGPPCEANSLSFFIIWTIFWVNPCIAVFMTKHLHNFNYKTNMSIIIVTMFLSSSFFTSIWHIRLGLKFSGNNWGK